MSVEDVEVGSAGDPPTQPGYSERNRNRKRKRLLIVLLVLGALLAAGAGGGVAWWLSGSSQNNAGGVSWASGSDADEDGTPEQPKGVRVPGYPSMVIDGGNVTHVPITNPDDNTYALDYKLTVDGEVLWDSGLIKPGLKVGEQRLSKTLPAGEHECLWLVQAWTLDDDPEGMNKVEMPCTITVR